MILLLEGSLGSFGIQSQEPIHVLSQGACFLLQMSAIFTFFGVLLPLANYIDPKTISGDSLLEKMIIIGGAVTYFAASITTLVLEFDSGYNSYLQATQLKLQGIGLRGIRSDKMVTAGVSRISSLCIFISSGKIFIDPFRSLQSRCSVCWRAAVSLSMLFSSSVGLCL